MDEPNIYKELVYKFLPTELIEAAREDLKRATSPGGETISGILVTILISGFNSKITQMTPNNLMSLLYSYHKCVSADITSVNGNIENLHGTSVKCYWNSEESDLNMILKKLVQMPARIQSAISAHLTIPLNDIHIAVHTGDVLVSNLGSEYHLERKVIGNNSYITSMLADSDNLDFSHVLVTDAVRDKLDDDWKTEFLTAMRGVGVMKEIKVYQLH